MSTTIVSAIFLLARHLLNVSCRVPPSSAARLAKPLPSSTYFQNWSSAAQAKGDGGSTARAGSSHLAPEMDHPCNAFHHHRFFPSCLLMSPSARFGPSGRDMHTNQHFAGRHSTVHDHQRQLRSSLCRNVMYFICVDELIKKLPHTKRRVRSTACLSSSSFMLMLMHGELQTTSMSCCARPIVTGQWCLFRSREVDHQRM